MGELIAGKGFLEEAACLALEMLSMVCAAHRGRMEGSFRAQVWRAQYIFRPFSGDSDFRPCSPPRCLLL